MTLVLRSLLFLTILASPLVWANEPKTALSKQECGHQINATSQLYKRSIHSLMTRNIIVPVETQDDAGNVVSITYLNDLHTKAHMAQIFISHMNKSDRELIKRFLRGESSDFEVQPKLDRIAAPITAQNRQCHTSYTNQTNPNEPSPTTPCVFQFSYQTLPSRKIKLSISNTIGEDASLHYTVALSGVESRDLNQVWRVYRAHLGGVLASYLTRNESFFDLSQNCNYSVGKGHISGFGYLFRLTGWIDRCAPIATEEGFVKAYAKVPASCFEPDETPSPAPVPPMPQTPSATESKPGNEKPLDPAGV